MADEEENKTPDPDPGPDPGGVPDGDPGDGPGAYGAYGAYRADGAALGGAAEDTQEKVAESARALLRELDLLGGAEEGPAGGAVEAAVSKAAMFWAAASGALVALAWAILAIWWSGEETANQVAAIGGAAIVTAAALLSISYMTAADVRSRAAVAVAAIQAREHIAIAMIESAAAAERASEALRASQASPPSELVALPKKVKVKYMTRPKGDKKGWTAIAIERRGGRDEGELRYLLVRGDEKAMADAKEVSFV
ncbi:MAG: hypothetical protein KDB58_11680 [Solirubrobacterales bacterium]|nr:hypothetical protein [Solirubrobacterales bacterium]MCB8970780.1 hypothetical protein [Thermoleophilales bacterium]